jgi:hypothetical protein
MEVSLERAISGMSESHGTAGLVPLCREGGILGTTAREGEAPTQRPRRRTQVASGKTFRFEWFVSGLRPFPAIRRTAHDLPCSIANNNRRIDRSVGSRGSCSEEVVSPDLGRPSW